MAHENLVIDEMKNKADAERDIANRKALKLSTKRKQRLLSQGASVEQIIQSTVKPSFAQGKPRRRGSDFERAIKNHR